ncbi:hypothetical protein TrST_g3469 [Triparma strigata]|uniref:cGMP-dependent protein kinase n=1 Tax=Triparma strigata TaxID=1606541 RepID=A0A9W7C2D7_9STRA|nr:hypothetical protein TrST_g3469 [Triparma strigata]
MSNFVRGSRSSSEPPALHSSTRAAQREVRGSKFDRSKPRGNRDSISDIPNSDAVEMGRKSSLSMPEGSSAQAMRNRKKKQALFGESLDPRALRSTAKKVIPKGDVSREIIANALLSHFLFSRLPDAEIITLVDAMEKFTLKPGEVAIKQGDEGDYFYIVEEGTFDIRVNDESVGTVEDVCAAFGELALMHNSPRAATLECTSAAILWGLDRNTFRATLAATSLNAFDDIISFLKNVDILEGLDDAQMSTLAQAVDVQRFQKGEMVVQKGDVGAEMFVIKEGSVVCKVQAEDHGQSSNIKHIDIDLGPGKFFGERALMYHELRAADVIATAELTCYTISANVFNMVLGSLKDVLETNMRMTLLKSLDIFASLDGSMLSKIVERLIPMEFDEEDEVICKGYRADHMFIIRTGNASLECSTGEDIVLGAGECFGEEALLKNDAYGTTVMAVNDLECLALMSQTLVDLECKLPGQNIARLRVASNSRFQNKHKARQSFGVGNLGHLANLDLHDEEEAEEELFQPINIKSITELKPGRTLGTGSFGRVRIATHTASGQILALKALQKEAIRLTRQEKNIMSERELTASLKHPFILHLYGTFQDSDCLYMLLEIVMGGELFRLLHGDGSVENKLNSADTAFYAACVLSVYDYIHTDKIVYRDLKPENILIATDGYLKIVDWGFAKKVVDKTYTTCGTPEYLSPELVQGTGHGKGVDYWALGVLIYEMLVGKTPYVGYDPDDTMGICRNIMNDNIEYPRGFPEDAQDLVEGLCTREVLARLGCMRGGCEDVKEHQFFENINWRELKQKKPTAPWTPPIKDSMDVSNFDDIYDDEPERIETYGGRQSIFKDF